MLLLTAAAIALSPGPARPAVQARATVRIISGVHLRLDGRPNANAPEPRQAIIRSAGPGEPRRARLIEFE